VKLSGEKNAALLLMRERYMWLSTCRSLKPRTVQKLDTPENTGHCQVGFEGGMTTLDVTTLM
jgi:hypothetical protein